MTAMWGWFVAQVQSLPLAVQWAFGAALALLVLGVGVAVAWRVLRWANPPPPDAADEVDAAWRDSLPDVDVRPPPPQGTGQ